MNKFLMILFLPIMFIFNIIGALSVLALVGYQNGYEFMLEQLKKTSEK
jgi:hypothetical protein